MNIKRVIDISRKIYSGMPVWPGDEDVEVKRDSSIENGDAGNLSSITMSLHAGTHIDMPNHFINEGATLESFDLANFIGTAKVFKIQNKHCIDLKSIEELDINEGDIILFKTQNSLLTDTQEFAEDFIYLDPLAARYLAYRKVKMVGIDYMSIDSFNSTDHTAHKMLLSNNIPIIEGLCLKDVDEGQYLLSCLPLKIEGVEASPVRAVLMEVEG